MTINRFSARDCVRNKKIKLGTRVSEPACFGAAPALGIFYPELAPAPAPGRREHNFGFFLN